MERLQKSRFEKSSRRGGFSMLEMQVAMVLFGIALTGLGPLAVMQSRQLTKLQARFSSQTTYYLVPSNDLWTRKLGASASVSTSSSSTSPSGGQPPAYDVQIQSLDKSLESQTVTATVTVQPI
jgi:prepilin-type N-terminal cleavage/methylation domain-containing protein